MHDSSTRPRPPLARFLFGTALAVAVPFLPGVAEIPAEARAVAGVATLTAWCWLTASLPLPVASLLPALLLPASGAFSAREVAPWYYHDILLLFLGGFLLAIALQKHGLHRRFALRALSLFGSSPRRLVLGFMVVAAGLSMFISNTSTALLMLPVAVAVLDRCGEQDRRRLTAPLLLGLAYACSIGGIATPIGTAPNSVLLGQLRDRFPEAPEIGFGTWFLGALPLVASFLFVAWWALTRWVHRLPAQAEMDRQEFIDERHQAGPRSREQSRVLWVFSLVALAWLTRSGADFGSFRLSGWSVLLPAQVSASISDATVVLVGVVALFLIPGRGSRHGALLDWEDAKNVPWGILLLLGGGFALAKAFDQSGLSQQVGGQVAALLQGTTPLITVLVLTLAVTFLTEITSNTATVNVMLPLLFSAAVEAEVHPLLLALPCTFAVSCAFMLPVATPPNAILFSSGRLRVPEMARAGLVLNLMTALLVTFFALHWIARVWGFDLDVFPAWAAKQTAMPSGHPL